METYVGTSGWSYSWNEGKSLEWYAKNSGLNAIELNSSFYRFPSRKQISSWAKSKPLLAWAVKVNRSITHVHMLNENSYEKYSEFTKSFGEMGSSVKLFLLQLSPRFSTKMEKRLSDFLGSFSQQRMALEFRHDSWYAYDFSKLDFDGVIVSPDSPEFNNRVLKKNDSVYIRFHGRRSWYSYEYGKPELKGMASKAIALHPKRLYAFFNNDAAMLKNAREFSEML